MTLSRRSLLKGGPHVLGLRSPRWECSDVGERKDLPQELLLDASVVFQKCLGHPSTDASGPAALLLLEIALLFLVVVPCRLRCLGTLGGSQTSETPH